MTTSDVKRSAPSLGRSIFVGDLTTGTLVAAAIAVCVGQVALAIPAVLNGLFQLGPRHELARSSPGSPTPSWCR